MTGSMFVINMQSEVNDADDTETVTIDDDYSEEEDDYVLVDEAEKSSVRVL